jgi:hypothetical protein
MKQWLRYKFDSTMSRGLGALIAWLFVFSAILAVVVAAFTIATDPKAHFTKVWWLDFQTTSNLKPGSGKLATVISTFIPNLGGMFMGGLLTGLIVGSIQTKLRNLRKGRSIVVEDEHQVILGWSSAVFTVIKERRCSRSPAIRRSRRAASSPRCATPRRSPPRASSAAGRCASSRSTI